MASSQCYSTSSPSFWCAWWYTSIVKRITVKPWNHHSIRCISYKYKPSISHSLHITKGPLDMAGRPPQASLIWWMVHNLSSTGSPAKGTPRKGWWVAAGGGHGAQIGTNGSNQKVEVRPMETWGLSIKTHGYHEMNFVMDPAFGPFTSLIALAPRCYTWTYHLRSFTSHDDPPNTKAQLAICSWPYDNLYIWHHS
jgi:hypothetical protein